MEVRLRLHRRDEEIEGNEAHIVDTDGRPLILIKFPIPEHMPPGEATDFMQKQGLMLREFLQQEFILMPTRPGDECEMGVLTPTLEDLKECVRLLPPDERRAFLIEMSEEHLKSDPVLKRLAEDDPDENDWGHIGSST